MSPGGNGQHVNRCFSTCFVTMAYCLYDMNDLCLVFVKIYHLMKNLSINCDHSFKGVLDIDL